MPIEPIGLEATLAKINEYLANAEKFNQANAKMEKSTKSTGAAGDDLSKKLGGLVKTLAASALAYEAFSQVKGAVSATENLGEAVFHLQKLTGTTAEDASHLVYAFKQLGLEGTTVERSIAIFSKRLQGVADLEDGTAKTGKIFVEHLQKMGVATVDANNKLLPTTTILGNIADAFVRLPDAAQKSSFASEAFGRAGYKLIPLLDLGRAGLEAMARQADKLGLTLSEKNVEQIHKYTLSQRQFGQEIEGLRVKIGLALLPVLTKLNEFFLAHAKDLQNFASQAIGAISRAASILEMVIQRVHRIVEPFIALFDKKDKMIIFVALLAGIAAAFLVVAVSAGVAFIAENAATLGIVAGVAVAVAGILMLIKHWDQVKAAFEAFGNWLKSNWEPIVIGVLTGPGLAIYLFRDRIVGVIKDIGNFISNIIAPFRHAAEALGGAISGPLSGILGPLKSGFVSAFQFILGVIDKAVAGVDKVVGWLDKIPGVAIGKLGSLKDIISGLGAAPDLTPTEKLIEGFKGLQKFFDDQNKKMPDLGAGGGDQYIAGLNDQLKKGSASVKETLHDLAGVWTASLIQAFADHETDLTQITDIIAKAIKEKKVTWADVVALDKAGADSVAMDFIHALTGHISDIGTQIYTSALRGTQAGGGGFQLAVPSSSSTTTAAEDARIARIVQSYLTQFPQAPLPAIPGAQAGGIVMRPTVLRVAEHSRPEAIVPLMGSAGQSFLSSIAAKIAEHLDAHGGSFKNYGSIHITKDASNDPLVRSLAQALVTA